MILISTTPSNYAAAALVGVLLAWAMQPAPEPPKMPEASFGACETATCLPAKSVDSLKRAMPIIERVVEFDV